MKNYDLVIIGGGPAGLAAAIAAYEKGIENIIIIEREPELGGILQQCIHNGFGIHRFNEELTGPAFAQRYIDLIQQNKIKYMLETSVIKIDKSKEMVIIGPKGQEQIKSKAIVLAMGCRERSRGAISIPGSRPAGIMSAGAAQKYLNMDGYLVGKKVFILGSGDIGLIMARRMTLEGAKVVGVAEIMPYSNGLTRNIVQCLNDFDIPLHLSHTITNIIGESRLEKIELSKVDHNFNIIKDSQKIIEVDALLLSVGLVPDNSLGEQIAMELSDKTKGAIVDENLATSVPGIFACGNVLHVHDIVDYVVNEANHCIEGVLKYLNKNQHTSQSSININPTNGINYIVPQILNIPNQNNKQRLYFRVNKLYSLARISIVVDNQVMFTFNKNHMVPAEMDYIEFDASKISSEAKEIKITLEELV